MSATPGPWAVSGVRQAFVGENCQRIVGSNGMALAFVPIGRDLPGALADCRLIVAAHDLLEAQTMGAEINTPDFLDWIADRLVNVHAEHPNADFVLSLRERAKAGRAAIAKATETTR